MAIQSPRRYHAPRPALPLSLTRSQRNSWHMARSSQILQFRIELLRIQPLKAAYLDSLMPIVCGLTPDTISLLAGLVAETFTTDQEDLHEIHREAFAAAMERLLHPPLLRAIAKDFEVLVGARILVGTWELPAAFHEASLAAPF